RPPAPPSLTCGKYMFSRPVSLNLHALHSYQTHHSPPFPPLMLPRSASSAPSLPHLWEVHVLVPRLLELARIAFISNPPFSPVPPLMLSPFSVLRPPSLTCGKYMFSCPRPPPLPPSPVGSTCSRAPSP
ncbi:unnamed protein product, partial [Closterium sp. Naga37s-1]